MGATPTAWAADTGAGAARVSATSAHAELTGRHAETLRPLPRPAQRQPPRARRPLPGDQEAHQEGDQGNPGRLTRRDQPPTTADLVSGEVPTPAGLNHKLRLSRRLRGLPTRQVVALDGPHPAAELVTVASRLRATFSSPACPRHALSIGPQRSFTDNHGSCPCPCPLNCTIGRLRAVRGCFPSWRCCISVRHSSD